ncbi:hypothetical protein GCM10007424_10440 [Flavobacterium suaedae]|uniref:Yip1 domain-containing protein n=1 Tax=Flavobacterium suaedae TaxID=1767027 RepID=A0ABQ1JQA9_9FLAO|nr:YIP1 family protein [Flavobacterium suaedae]GGB72398.1 hypothetical protein GCM10007424_10440 [Flavobacterium suaedae]
MKTLLLNPFKKYTEKQLILIGIVFTVLGSLSAYWFNARYDGVLDLHFATNVAIETPFIENAVNIVLLSFTLYMLGIYINKKTRIADVLSTVLLARLPFYLLTLINISSKISNIERKVITSNPYDIRFAPSEIVYLLVLSILILVFIVWHIALLYNGFKVAANLKTTNQKILFAVTILITEIISKILFYTIL